MIWRNIFSVREFLSFPHCVLHIVSEIYPQCGKTRYSLPCKIFSSNQLRVKFFSKKLISRNFFEKMVAVKLYYKFQHFAYKIWQFFRQIDKNSSNQHQRKMSIYFSSVASNSQKFKGEIIEGFIVKKTSWSYMSSSWTGFQFKRLCQEYLTQIS